MGFFLVAAIVVLLLMLLLWPRRRGSSAPAPPSAKDFGSSGSGANVAAGDSVSAGLALLNAGLTAANRHLGPWDGDHDAAFHGKGLDGEHGLVDVGGPGGDGGDGEGGGDGDGGGD